jgi:hypothetical protein
LAFSTKLFHSFLFPVNSFQFFTFSTSISLMIPSIHLFFGLPAGLFPNGFQLVSFFNHYLLPLPSGNMEAAVPTAEDTGNKFLRNIGTCLPNCTASQPRSPWRSRHYQSPHSFLQQLQPVAARISMFCLYFNRKNS